MFSGTAIDTCQQYNEYKAIRRRQESPGNNDALDDAQINLFDEQEDT